MRVRTLPQAVKEIRSIDSRSAVNLLRKVNSFFENN